MAKKLRIKDASGNFIDVTSEILSVDNITELKYLLNNYNHIEYAYIRTKTREEIDDLINVITYIDGYPININTMFYMPYDNKYGNIPYNSKFIDVERFNNSSNTTINKLFKKFQNSNFIVSAIYRGNDIMEAIDDAYWTTQPQGVNSEYKYEWQIQRTRKMVKNKEGEYVGLWDYFTYPILINSYSNTAIENEKFGIWVDEHGIHIKNNNNLYDVEINNDNLSLKKLVTL